MIRPAESWMEPTVPGSAPDAIDSIRALSVEQLCQSARDLAKAGDFVRARDAYSRAMHLAPCSTEAVYGVATSSFLLDDLDGAESHFRQVLTIDPGHASAAVNLGAIANRRGQYRDAVRLCKQAIRLDRRRAEGYYNLAIAYRRLHRPELAIKSYRAALRRDNRMVDAIYNLANLYLDCGKIALASIYYRRVLELAPEFKRAETGLAEADRRRASQPVTANGMRKTFVRRGLQASKPQVD